LRRSSREIVEAWRAVCSGYLSNAVPLGFKKRDFFSLRE
jgi:hypothetical protein